MSQNIQSCFRRYENKYFLTPLQQELLLKKIQDNIVSDEYPNYTICSLYYDTDNWELVRASLDKPDYKEKLRVRTYGIPDSHSKGFVEIKKKFDGVVYKRRIVTDYFKTIPFLSGQLDESFGQIGNEISWFQHIHNAKPKVFIAYDRTAFAGIDDSELRITFDKNIRFRTNDLNLSCGDYGRPVINDDRILMEIKIPEACPMWLSKALSDVGARPTSFSKYGACYKDYILPNIADIVKEVKISA